MQENRAFDHYYGKMKGVRGFNDRMGPKLPNGKDVFHQPTRVDYPDCTAEQDAACTDIRTAKDNTTCPAGDPKVWKGKGFPDRCQFPFLHNGKKFYGCDRYKSVANNHYSSGSCLVNGTWNEKEGAYVGGKWKSCMCPQPADGYQLPFPVIYENTSATCMGSPGMSFVQDHEIWNNGKVDGWLTSRGFAGYSMAHARREDLPYYYALADAFTIGDQYHQATMTSTNPNRMHLFSGSNGVGQLFEEGTDKLKPPYDSNKTCPEHFFQHNFEYLPPANISKANCELPYNSRSPNKAFEGNPSQNCGNPWESTAETMQKAGVTWAVYQENHNFGDNGWEWHHGMRDALFAERCGRATEYQKELVKRGWRTTGGSACDIDFTGSQLPSKNTANEIAGQFESEVKAGTVPQVSIFVAGACQAEHPPYHPQIGEALSSQLIDVLKRNPEFYAKTAFILNYDEGGQFFDHQWPPMPPKDNNSGKSTVTTQGEIVTPEMVAKGMVFDAGNLDGPTPNGLGYRVPLMLISPWTRGGYVFSETSDHTSVIKFIEKRFPHFKSPNISPWRRAMTSDLTAAFNFTHPNFTFPDLPSTADNVKLSGAQCDNDPVPPVPVKQQIATQEPGQKPARALPYELDVALQYASSSAPLELQFTNTGAAGATFAVFDELNRSVNPKFYSVGAGKTLEDSVEWLMHGSTQNYSISVFGPNGFARTFEAPSATSTDARQLHSVSVSYVMKVADGQRQTDTAVRLTVPKSKADATAQQQVTVQLLTYWGKDAKVFNISMGSSHNISVLESDNWYDVEVSCGTAKMRLLGRVEDGLPTKSDPAMAVKHHHFQDATTKGAAISDDEMTAMNAALMPVPTQYVGEVKGWMGPPIKPGYVLRRKRYD